MSTQDSGNILNDQSIRVRVLNWIKTTRVQTGMVTALALWIGYISVSPLNLQSAILLGVVGLLVHIWGFTLNEVEDYKYDAVSADVDGHPIAQGKVHADAARYLAWISGFIAIAISVLTPYPTEASLVLLASFIPGYMYNKYSKTHPWSNIYLSGWAFLMVLTGGMYAGSINILTTLIAVAVSIQIFVQVIEGDMKDIEGPEKTFAEMLGVEIKQMGLYEDMEFSTLSSETDVTSSKETCVVKYTKPFTIAVYSLKIIEVVILLYVARIWTANNSLLIPYTPDKYYVYYTILLLLVVAFFTTLSRWMVYCYNRADIKKKSGLHELTSIVLLGAVVFPLSPYSAVIIGILPVLWYIVLNYIVHSGALNPDI